MFSHGERGPGRTHGQGCAPESEDKLGWIETSAGGYVEAIQTEADRAGDMEGKRFLS